MVVVKFRNSDGTETQVDAVEGWTVMETARKFGVDGIVAECGGAATCSTCHIYLGEPWSSRVPPLSEIEDMLLELAPDRRPEQSRLSCQIVLDDQLDGITIEVPAEQYGG